MKKSKIVKTALLCASLLLFGCSSSGTEAVANANVKTALEEASKAFSDAQAVTADYTHFRGEKDGLSHTYKVTIETDSVSDATRAEGHEDLRDGDSTVIYNPISEYYYDTDSGVRYVYMETSDGYQPFSFKVNGTVYDDLNVARQLFADYSDGYTALKAVRNTNEIIVTGSSRRPAILSIEGFVEDEDDDIDWDVEVSFRSGTMLPIKATFKKGDEEIIVDYSTFNEHLDIQLPEIEDVNAEQSE